MPPSKRTLRCCICRQTGHMCPPMCTDREEAELSGDSPGHGSPQANFRASRRTHSQSLAHSLLYVSSSSLLCLMLSLIRCSRLSPEQHKGAGDDLTATPSSVSSEPPRLPGMVDIITSRSASVWHVASSVSFPSASLQLCEPSSHSCYGPLEARGVRSSGHAPVCAGGDRTATDGLSWLRD